MTTSTHARPGPHAVYTGRATNWLMVSLSSVLLVPLILASRADPGAGRTQDAVVLGLVVVGVLLEVITATSVRTAVGPNGVAVRWGVLGWPRVTYRVGDVRRAEVIDLPWWAVAFGFWWTPRRTCCTVRPGPALKLTLTNGRTVTVTVPDPETAVAALAQARLT
jgi:hypothetical protein